MVLVVVLIEGLTLGFTGLAFVTFDFEVLDVVALDFVVVLKFVMSWILRLLKMTKPFSSLLLAITIVDVYVLDERPSFSFDV